MTLSSVSKRFIISIVGLVALAVLSGAISLRALGRMDQLLRQLATITLENGQAGLQLENALLEQQGLVSRAIALEHPEAVLQELEWRSRRWQPIFETVRGRVSLPRERELLERIEARYRELRSARSSAVQALRAGQREAAQRQVEDRIDPLSREAHALCQQFVLMQRAAIAEALADGQRNVLRASIVVYLGFVLTTISGVLLVYLLLRRVFRPLRRMAGEASHLVDPTAPGFEGDDLGRFETSFRSIVRNAEDTRASLARSEGQLREAEAAGKLAACVAHEVRSPLQSMSFALHSFQREVASDPALLERCRMFREEIDRLESIVRDFLEFARPPKLRFEALAVDPVVDSTVAMFSERALQAGIRVRVTRDGSVPRVRADARQIRQVLHNLLANAIQAMPEGGEVEVSRMLEPNGAGPCLSVRVRDQGGGIPEPARSQLFEPFVTTRGEGTGLGLAIAASIAARHGGSLALESTGPAGTTFVLHLPVTTD